MTRYRRIAHISRVKGLSGEVVAVCADNLPFHFWEGQQLWVVPPDHGLIRETLVRAVRQNADTLILRLEGVDDVAAAQRLVGRYLLARETDLEVEPEQERQSFLGLSVSDSSAGFIGIVTEVCERPSQLLLVVEGPQGEVLIPAVDEFIKSCTETGLTVSLPQGLLELNR